MELLEAHSTAPAKLILFGEHAVVYGEPSLSLALSKRTAVSGQRVGDGRTVNGYPMDGRFHRYLDQAVQLYWKSGPLRLQTESGIPSGSGIGSSAALSVATVAVLLRLQSQGPVSAESIARGAFEAEYTTQGAASPNDTTVSAAGGGVLLSPTPRDEAGMRALWSIRKGERAWHAHRVRLPRLGLVVANSGAKGNTADQVAKVRRFVERNTFARDVVRDIGQLTLRGVDALASGDLRTVGDLMNQNHAYLHTLGVDTPRLAELVSLARRAPGTLGAKLTGAGGGGSMVVLTEAPAEALSAMERAGAASFIVESSDEGVHVEP